MDGYAGFKLSSVITSELAITNRWDIDRTGSRLASEKALHKLAIAIFYLRLFVRNASYHRVQSTGPYWQIAAAISLRTIHRQLRCPCRPRDYLSLGWATRKNPVGTMDGLRVDHWSGDRGERS